MPTVTLWDTPKILVVHHVEQRIIHHEIREYCYGAAFRDALTAGVLAMEEHRADRWLSDDRKNGPVAPEDDEWINNVWFLGKLNVALGARGRECLSFDRRRKHLDVPFAEREFTLDEPCAADLVVGMHADGATRIIVEYAARHRLPFAIVPCCSDNSMPYKPWMRHLDELARGLGLRTSEALLPMRGRARTLLGWP